MGFQQELQSWLSPHSVSTSSPPTIGSSAPSSSLLTAQDFAGKSTIVTFLRHCGCPFAEKTFLSLRPIASTHPTIQLVAVSHSDEASTERWLEAVGGARSVKIVVDPERKVYGLWGLGVATWGHVLSLQGFRSAYKLGKENGIWNRPTESGSRWQIGGAFAIDSQAVVRWGQVAPSADWIPDFEEAAGAIAE